MVARPTEGSPDSAWAFSGVKSLKGGQACRRRRALRLEFTPKLLQRRRFSAQATLRGTLP
jgi:hypothetical protein